MDRTTDGLEDTLAAEPSSQTRITVDGPGTDPTLIAGTVDVAAVATAKPSDRYKLGDVLGRGGMGEVLRAADQQIGGRAVAIKRLRGNASDHAVARFLREAKI